MNLISQEMIAFLLYAVVSFIQKLCSSNNKYVVNDTI